MDHHAYSRHGVGHNFFLLVKTAFVCFYSNVIIRKGTVKLGGN